MIFLDAALSTIVLSSVVVFLLVILLLVALLLYTKQKLTPGGVVKISINDGERIVETEPGSTLLSILGNEKIFLPSACGGGGTCRMCRCQIPEGGEIFYQPKPDFLVASNKMRTGGLLVRLKCGKSL